MEKKESSNTENSSFPNKDIHESYNCKCSNSFGVGRISEFLDEYDTLYDTYLWDLERNPYLIKVSIGPELQKLRMEEICLFVGNLIFKTENGVVVVINDATGFHQSLLPTQKQNRDHASKLAETAHTLLHSDIFKSSIEEQMIHNPWIFHLSKYGFQITKNGTDQLLKDNKICKGKYIPYDKKLDKKDYVEKHNSTFDYVRRFGIELDTKGRRIFNPVYIIINNTQVLINRSFFKGDLTLLKTLVKLPNVVMEDILRTAFRTVGNYFGNTDDDFWNSKNYILIDDFDPSDLDSKVSEVRRRKVNERTKF